MWNGLSVWEGKKVLEMDVGDDCTTVWMYLVPLKCTVKNGQKTKFCVLYILPLYVCAYVCTNHISLSY